MASLKILGVIPARLTSRRLPRKALRMLGEKALVHHVYDRAVECPLFSDVLIATDSPEIESYCQERDLKVMMTAATHISGTDRVQETATRIEADVYANIQGDEPLITPQHLELLVRPFEENEEVRVTTLKTRIEAATAENSNVTKVVTDRGGRALYFSRLPIPYGRSSLATPVYFKHLGLYAYRRQVLLDFPRLPGSKLEAVEKLEQLRFLENGIPVQVVETDQDTVGVDTEEDLLKAAELLAQREGSK